MLTINLEFDAAAAAAPQSFRDGVQAAANILEAAIYNPITVNILVGYGEIDLGGPAYSPLSIYSEGGILSLNPISYQTLRSTLAAHETSASATAAVNALPNTTSLNGRSTFYISSAQEKAFGIIPATRGGVDGVVGFPTSYSGAGLVGTAIVEELHAMGLLNAGGDLGLVSYTSPGVHFLPTSDTASTPAYFSLDGGVTDLANYNVGSDETLFLNQPNDPLDFPNQGTVLSPLDLAEISAIGFNDTAPLGSTAVAALDPAAVAINAAGIFTFANAGAPSFTAMANQDATTDLGYGAGALTPAFIGGYVAGAEIRVMANLEHTGGSTAQIDAQFGANMDSLSALLTPGSLAEGFGFLAGLTAGGTTLGAAPAALQVDIRIALGTDQKAISAVSGAVVGAVTFTQSYVSYLNSGLTPLAALHGAETTAVV